MRNVWIVIRHEIKTTLGKPSFWIMGVLFPAVLLGINIAVQFAISANSAEQAEKNPLAVQAEALPIGYVDESGLVNQIPGTVPPGTLRRFDDHESARRALEAGEIEPMVLIPADYAEKGRLEITMRNFTPLGATPEDLFHYLLVYNLTGDEVLSGQIIAPTGMQEEYHLSTQTSTGENPLGTIVPSATLFIFFFLITMSSGWMLQSVSREKVNRMAEVLLLSLDSRELMLGKILGLSVVALVQMILWVGGGMLLLGRGPEIFQIGAGLQLPLSFLLLSLVYFALGYLMYASLMGAVGALSPDLRDASNFTFYIVLPLIVPLILNAAFTSNPGGIIPVILSLFPLTAPSSMLTRVAVSSVPGWQIGASLFLLLLTTAAIVNISARAFRADTLLSNSPLRWQRLKYQLGGAGRSRN